jgi:D-lyxose ketol-isomerase
MKRSLINREITHARELLRSRGFYLPAFADWSRVDWQQAGSEYDRVKINRLGWDVTDFGHDDFDHFGGVLFTIRNGNHQARELGCPYAEKAIILKPGQRMPLHMHWSKMEDIINRGGGNLMFELYCANDDDSLDRTTPVKVYCDGREMTIPAGAPFCLKPGESMTVTPRLFHKFWADANTGMLFCGEVSTVNDDETDNCFAEPVERFSQIEEDEPALWVLCNEYDSIHS